MEKKYDIPSRWKPSDYQYNELKMHLLSEKKLEARTALWSSVVKRHYLLRMKAKYAGMYTFLLLLLLLLFDMLLSLQMGRKLLRSCVPV